MTLLLNQRRPQRAGLRWGRVASACLSSLRFFCYVKTMKKFIDACCLVFAHKKWTLSCTLSVALAYSCAESTLTADASVTPSDSLDAGVENDAGVLPSFDAGAMDAGVTMLPDAGQAQPVACGMALPGPAFRPTQSEAKTTFAKYSAELDSLTLPEVLDFSAETKLQKALVQYLVQRSTNLPLAREQVEQLGPMGKALLGASAKSTKAKEVDVPFLKLGLYFYYPCSSGAPPTLEALKAKYGDYTQWRTEDVACGRPKNGPRRLYENDEKGVYLAETLDNGQVRETEVIFAKSRIDGQLNFAVYTPEGQLTDRSTFATTTGNQIVSAAPFACMGCHYNVSTERFDDLRPADTGAGCRVSDGGVKSDAGMAVDAGP